MEENLKKVLNYISKCYSDKAESGARHYLNANIGQAALALGFEKVYERYKNRDVVVSLKEPQPGMKVRIDGRTFVKYVEYANGFSVPEHIARFADLPYRKYIAQDSMILNFT